MTDEIEQIKRTNLPPLGSIYRGGVPEKLIKPMENDRKWTFLRHPRARVLGRAGSGGLSGGDLHPPPAYTSMQIKP